MFVNDKRMAMHLRVLSVCGYVDIILQNRLLLYLYDRSNHIYLCCECFLLLQVRNFG